MSVKTIADLEFSAGWDEAAETVLEAAEHDELWTE